MSISLRFAEFPINKSLTENQKKNKTKYENTFAQLLIGLFIFFQIKTRNSVDHGLHTILSSTNLIVIIWIQLIKKPRDSKQLENHFSLSKQNKHYKKLKNMDNMKIKITRGRFPLHNALMIRIQVTIILGVVSFFNKELIFSKIPSLTSKSAPFRWN